MSIKNKCLTILLVLILLSSNSSFVVADTDHPESIVNVQSSSDEGMILDIKVPWKDLQVTKDAETKLGYTQLSIPGFAKIAQEGAPGLPVLRETIAVPPGVEIVINVVPGEAHTQALESPVLPVATQVFTYPELTEEGAPLGLPQVSQEILEDPGIYDASAAYPGVFAEITNEGTLRGQHVAGITFFPVQYEPGKQQITIYESLHVSISFKGTMSIQGDARTSESWVYEGIFKDNLLNYEESRGWRQSSSEMDPSLEINNGIDNDRTIPWTPPAPGWRVTVKEEGIYKLTYEQLTAVDFPTDGVDQTKIQMFHNGTEITIQMIDMNLDGIFNAGDSIIFYGGSIKSKYTNENVYWLTHGSHLGMRMSSRDVTPDPENPNTPTYYDSSMYLEENIEYMSWMPGADDLERFVWTFLSNSYPQRNINISLPALYNDVNATLKMALLGYSNNRLVNPDHHAIIYVNDEPVADVNWDGRTWMLVDVPIPAEVLMDGDNIVKIENPSSIYDAYYIDWFEIGFKPLFVAQENTISFDFAEIGTTKFQIAGFSDVNLVAYDVTGPNAVKQLVGFDVQTSGLESTLTFQDEITTPASYLVTSDANYLSPVAIDLDTPSDLQNPTNGADYIVITHELFADHLSELKDLRITQGLRVIQVDVQDIYDEFNFGKTDAEAIKQFLSFAYENWEGIAPSYVLLVGDGHYNPKNYNPGFLGFNRQSYIPPYLAMVDPFIGETASDNRYVTLVGSDPLPDMMIGRLAVNSVVGLTAFIDKILANEVSPADGDWKRQVLAVADNLDAAGSFPASSQTLLSCCLPDHYQAERIYLGITHDTIVSARNALISGINSGKFLVNYIGHAAYSQWAGFDDNPAISGYLLRTADIAGLSNSGKYPVILALTCYEGYFQHPHPLGSFYESMGEVVTKAEGKGAVASWSPTGAGLATGHDILNQGFFNAVFADNVEILGEATTSAKLDLWATGSNLDLVDTYMLFGDPATNFVRDLMAVNDAYQVDEDKALYITNVAEGVLANDINPEGATLNAVLVDDVSNGELTLYSDGTFTYTPNPDYSGMDSFTYKANDGYKDSNIATVTITVNPINDPPVAHDQEVSTPMNTPINITLTADDDGTAIGISSLIERIDSPDYSAQTSGLTFSIVDEPDHGFLEGDEGSPYRTYTPDPDYTGEDHFTFKANDGEFDSNVATVTITVTEGSDISIYLPLILK